VSASASRLLCAGCGVEPADDDPYPFTCPAATPGDDIDHVLRRVLDLSAVRFPTADPEPNPFVRFRAFLRAYHVAIASGLDDAWFCRLVERLDGSVADLEGHGFRTTPFWRSHELSTLLRFSSRGGVWVKDETGGPSGSHKARHLFGVLLWLEVAERVGLADALRPRELAIASCGNAALAAAVVAAAGGRRLRVFVPVDAEAAVLARLEELGAQVTICPRRPGELGDPTVRRLREAIATGALPFTCQGDLNGLAVEGGETLGYEIAAALAAGRAGLDHVVVQVGGGALGSAVASALREASTLGAIDGPPRLHTVQSEGAAPLRRAFTRVAERCAGGSAEDVRAAVAYAAHHRSAFMWPWEQEPASVAHGILDDETYDWLLLVEEMLATGGAPVVVDEATLVSANALARTTGVDVDHTGSAGLAGLLRLRAEGRIGPDDRVAVLFTGVRRSHRQTEGHRDEELSRARHPVAQGL
jgi:threonine synthase